MFHTLKTVFYDNWRCKKTLLFAYLGSGMIAVALQLYSVYIGNNIIAVLEESGSTYDFYFWLGVLGLSGILFVVLKRMSHAIRDYRWASLYAYKAHLYLEKYLQMDYQTITEVGTGKSLTRLQKGINAEANLIESLCIIFINSVWKGAIIIAMISYFERRVLPIIGVVFLVTFAIDRVVYRYLLPTRKKLVEHSEESGRFVARMVMEHQLVKLSNMKGKELSSYEKFMSLWPHYEKKMVLVQYLGFDILAIGVRAAEFVVFFWLGWEVLQGNLSLASLLLLVSYIRKLWDPISTTIHEIAHINKNIVTYQSLRDFIRKPIHIIDGDHKFIFEKGEITIKNLSFGYQHEKNIFSNLNIHIPAKQTTALVGHSGSGKSTLIKLLLRLYDANSGSILYDGQELKTLQKKTIYQHIGYVSQEPAIFDGSAVDNLIYGLDCFDGVTIPVEGLPSFDNKNTYNNPLEKLAHVIDASHCHFLYDLPNGLQTQLGEKGVKLSGGERQRLAIARLMLRNPAIVILDEPTSALDSISEEIITQALHELTRDKTVIVIAHRLQTVQHADNIIVLENGSVIEEGDHQTLLQQEGVYATLVDLQHGRIH